MPRNPRVSALTETLKKNPDVMIHDDRYLAVYDSELEQCVMIPGHFAPMPRPEAERVLQSNLTALKGR